MRAEDLMPLQEREFVKSTGPESDLAKGLLGAFREIGENFFGMFADMGCSSSKRAGRPR